MRTDGRRASGLGGAAALLLAALLATDCTSDHHALALRPHAAGAGGKAGAGGAGGKAGTGGRPHGGGTSQGGTGGTPITPDKHVEPTGRSVFTVVHGVVDAERLAWCFGRVRDGATRLVGNPTPEGGLAYGESLSFEELSHIDSEKDGVVPYVITGDLSLIAGLDCEDAVALAEAGDSPVSPPAGAAGAAGAGEGGGGGQTGEGAGGAGAGGESGTGTGTSGESGAPANPIPKPPALRVGTLPGLPAGALAQGYSLLEVADGCFGAAEFVDAQAEEICGAGYTPSVGTLTAEFVILGRATTAEKLALQALHASRGSPSLGVRAIPPADAVQSAATLVDNFSEGALRPAEPRQDLSTTGYGTAQRTWSVEATVNGSPAFHELWLAIERRSGIPALKDGRGYTVIVIGPSYRVEDSGWWNPPAFALIDNDPGGD